MRNVLLIDNFDSFTFNLVESFERLGANVRTVRNSIDAASAFKAASENEALIVLSPGPGHPETAGCCLELIRLAKAKIPVLGICLGHQAILLEAGGTIRRAPVPVHGKASLLKHDGKGPFAGLERPVRVGRYHSLGLVSPPSRIHVHAAIDGMVMAISDAKARQIGLQFHPESILTPDGDKILANVLREAGVR